MRRLSSVERRSGTFNPSLGAKSRSKSLHRYATEQDRQDHLKQYDVLARSVRRGKMAHSDAKSGLLHLMDVQEAVIKHRYPGRIILIRHGESEGNVDDSIYQRKPDVHVRLTSAGKRQAIEAGVRLCREVIPPDETVRFVVSPYWRTIQTFEGILRGMRKVDPEVSQRVLDVTTDPAIREQEFGMLQKEEQMRQARKDRRQVGSFFYRFPNGESGADVYSRLDAFMSQLLRNFRSGVKKHADNYVIVTHGLTMRLFLMRWFKWSIDEFHGEEKRGRGRRRVVWVGGWVGERRGGGGG